MQRISAYDRITNAVRQIVPDVMNTAAAMDTELQVYMANRTTLPYLFCVPILIKDNMDATDGKLSVLCCCCFAYCCIAVLQPKLGSQVISPWQPKLHS